jgi:hypothetical protein
MMNEILGMSVKTWQFHVIVFQGKGSELESNNYKSGKKIYIRLTIKHKTFWGNTIFHTFD